MKTKTPVPSPDASHDPATSPEETPGWRVPSGPALVEFAFRKGFLAGMLLRPRDGSGHGKNECRKV